MIQFPDLTPQEKKDSERPLSIKEALWRPPKGASHFHTYVKWDDEDPLFIEPPSPVDFCNLAVPPRLPRGYCMTFHESWENWSIAANDKMVELCKAGDFQAIYDFDQAVSDFNKQVKGTFGIELLPYWDGSFDGHEEPQLPQEYYAFAECQELTKRSEPRKDFPTDFEEAYRWADVANNGAQDWERPIWRWDCGFKLDYDGPILRFNSRFYPPKAHYGDTWDGVVTVVLLGEEIHQEEFDCETLEDLKNAVQKYTEDYRQQLLQLLGKQ